MSALGTRKRISAKHAQRPPHLVLLETKFEFIAHPFSVIIWTKIRYTSSNGRRRRILLYAIQETSTIYVYGGKNEKNKTRSMLLNTRVYLVRTYTFERVENPVAYVSYSCTNPKGRRVLGHFYREMTNNRDPTIFETFFNDLFVFCLLFVIVVKPLYGTGVGSLIQMVKEGSTGIFPVSWWVSTHLPKGFWLRGEGFII